LVFQFDKTWGKPNTDSIDIEQYPISSPIAVKEKSWVKREITVITAVKANRNLTK